MDHTEKLDQIVMNHLTGAEHDLHDRLIELQERIHKAQTKYTQVSEGIKGAYQAALDDPAFGAVVQEILYDYQYQTAEEVFETYLGWAKVNTCFDIVRFQAWLAENA